MSNTLTRPFGWLRERWPDALALLMLALVCWLLARWTWVLFAPAAPGGTRVPPATVNLQASLDEILRAGLFSSTPAGDLPIAASTHRNLKLVGVLATNPQGRGWAIVNLNNKDHEVAATGAEFASGMVLHQVFPDHAVIRRQGNLERIDLAIAKPGESPAVPRFDLNVQQRGAGDYAFSRGELDRALRSPRQLSNLGALSVNAETGVRIEQAPSGSLAEKLGLRPGDIIGSVNGQRVAREDDLRRLYEQFNQTRQTAWVVLEGRRNDAPLRLRYTVQP